MTSLKQNLLYSVSYQILSIILPLITAPYLSRVLGPDKLGEYSFTHSVANYFMLMAMLGIQAHGNRSVAAARDDLKKRSETFWHIYAIQAATNLVAICLYCGYVALWGGASFQIFCLQSFYVISSLLDISWLFFGMEQFNITVSRNACIKAATTALIFFLVKRPEDLWKYTLIFSLGSLCSQLYLWLCLRGRIRRPAHLDAKRVVRQIRPILTLFLPVLAYSVYKVMDKIMLGAMSAYSEVGYYENAYKINSVLIVLLTAVGNVMLPRSAHLIAAGRKEESLSYMRRTFLLINALVSPLVFGIAAVARDFTLIYYGPAFERSASLMVCLNWTVFFAGWASVLRTQYLIPYYRDKIYVVSTLGGAAVNLLLNLSLIPALQSMGAAIGTFGAEFSVMAIQTAALRKELPFRLYLKDALPYFLSAFLMFLLVRAVGARLPCALPGLALQIGIGGAAYAAFAWTAAVLRKDEIYALVAWRLRKRAGRDSRT